MAAVENAGVCATSADLSTTTRTVVPRWGWACAVAGLGSLAWVPISLLPGPVPAWPGLSLGLFAWAASRMPAPVGLRALGTISGTLGMLAAAAQIALLWTVAWGATGLS